jgi:hypothetical protein
MSEVRCLMSDVREGGESVTEQIKSAKDLRVYKRAYALSMEIFVCRQGDVLNFLTLFCVRMASLDGWMSGYATDD